jgi:hypothetical protein
MKTDDEIKAWTRGANHYARLAGGHPAPSSQLACLILADYCVYEWSGDRGGTTQEMIRLAESILGVSLDKTISSLMTGDAGASCEREAPVTAPPPKYDPEITASLVTEARLLVTTPNGAFSAPDLRAVDLAIRLVAPGPKACAVSASECHEIAEAVIAAYDQGAFPIRAHKVITALVDQLEAAGGAAKDASKWYDEVHELRSRLERSDTALAAAGAPMHELLTDEGAEWVRRERAAITLQLNAAQVDCTLPLSVQVKTLCDESDALRKERLLVAARRGELETDLRSMTSLCDKAQHDRDFFRSQAEERGRELRDAMSGAAQLTARHNRTTDELHACRKLRDETLEQCKEHERTIAGLTMRVKQRESAGKPNPKKPSRARIRKRA